jgi:DNA-binding MarR family transcriptional regulator
MRYYVLATLISKIGDAVMTVRDRIQQSGFASSAEAAMVGLLVAAGHVEQALAEACDAHGITPDQYNVLRILRGAHPGGHPRYEIADRLIHRAPDVTRLLDRLERQGLVERTRSAEDRRLSLSRISAAGLKLLRRLDPQVLGVHERFAAGLSESQRGQLVRLCDAVLG